METRDKDRRRPIDMANSPIGVFYRQEECFHKAHLSSGKHLQLDASAASSAVFRLRFRAFGYNEHEHYRNTLLQTSARRWKRPENGRKGQGPALRLQNLNSPEALLAAQSGAIEAGRESDFRPALNASFPS
ncbi:hypothetical protein [Pseudomonas sp. NBRC 100443]|uniref:hypothetical protein n=1 Tax=Pseudomonas sp. NBRC 100443 TaxID=1113665 RepID=UPI002555947F|nr:hypothetical protein [Pseudomonas sp. NBRC 100443]